MPRELRISEISTRAPKGLEKEDVEKEYDEMTSEIADLQYKIKAEEKHSLLVIFQGMDASGKDGATHKVFRKCGVSGVQSFSFKKPTDKEFAHDFLWRVHKLTPGKGEIVIFNRSHYEDILIQRVHEWIDEDRVNARINAINAFEELLEKDNNTTILKFYMHISEERQKEKLQERIDVPRKNWKHKDADWEERKLWDKYMRCYQDAIDRCNKVPWIIAPCDQRWYRNYFVAKKVLTTLRTLNPQLPALETKNG
jgi:PPK2 family polyphosphate:nucleotide phosphotransferase